jgi:hypothetical protein
MPPAPAVPPPPRVRGRARWIAIASVVAAFGLLLGFGITQLDGDPSAIDGGAASRIVDEDFASASDWYAGEDGRAAARVVDGSYHVDIKRRSSIFVATSGLRGRWDGVSVEVVASPGEGSREVLVGVGCEAERGRGYHFLVDPWNSRYLVMESRTDGTFAELGGGTDLVRTIHPPGETNRLRAECVHQATNATALRFFVNERPIFALNVRDGWEAYRGTSVATASVGAANVSAVYDDASMTLITDPTDPRIAVAETLVPEPDPSIVSVELLHQLNGPRAAPFGTERGTDHSFGYESGEYRITVDSPGTWWRWRWIDPSTRSFPAVSVATTARKGTLDAGRGRFGVYCVSAADPDDIYGFLVDPDEGWYQIWKLEDDEYETVLAEGASAIIGFGTDPSLIRGDCSSRDTTTDLSMYVNGWFVASVQDTDGLGMFDGVGVITRAIDPGADARFDNILYAHIRP